MADTFAYVQTARVVYGVGALAEVALELRHAGGARALLVTDRTLRERTDLVARVEAALGRQRAGTWDGVVPDATVASIDEGAARARAAGADALVSLGGGSAIDTAKGIAICLTLGGGIRDHQGSQFLGRPTVPHLAIPTTAGTGSEVSVYAVVKDPDAREKMHYVDDHLIPKVALLDPEATYGMPPALTAATGCDALTHAVEAYTSLGRNPLSDAQALHATRLIARHLLDAQSRPRDPEPRGALLLASNLAGAAMSNAAVGLCHALAHVLGARHGVHHGLANGICLPHVIRFDNDELAARHRDLAEALGQDVRGLSDEAAGLRAADAVAALLSRVGLPARLREAGVPESDLDGLADAALADGAIVYNGKFAADAALVRGVLAAAW